MTPSSSLTSSRSGMDRTWREALRPRVNDPRRRPWTAWALVALACGFNLWSLRSERLSVDYPNDSALHLQMSTLAHELLSHSTSPLDHWYGLLSLGSPFFVEYQSSSAILVGGLGHFVATPVLFAWSLYLLLSLWPLCLYASGRLLGWGPAESSVAGLLAPLLFSVTGRGFEHQSYVWVGSGLWSQLWAMWTLPLAWGASWRFIRERRYFWLATVMVALTIIFHFLTAYLALIALGVWCLVAPREWRQRVWRAAAVAGGALVMSAWVLWPLLARSKWLAVNQFQVGTTINNSYGGPRVITWLLEGAIYDHGRLPLITLSVGAGIALALWRWRSDERGRSALIMWVIAMILFIGRPTLSWLIDLIPGNANLLLQRYISGVQLAGLFLAASAIVTGGRVLRVGATYLYGDVVRWWSRQRLRPLLTVALAVAVAVVTLSPAWLEIERYDHRSASWISYQRSLTVHDGGQLTSLIAIIDHRGGGRVYAGMPSNWGRTFYFGDVPIYIYLEQHMVDTVGFTLRTSGLMTDPEAYFDQSNPGDYALFGIHYLLLPTTGLPSAPPVPAVRIAHTQYYSLWRLASTGLFHVVDTRGTISATAANLGPQTSGFLESSLVDRAIYPTIAFAGHAGAPATLLPGEHVSGVAGTVLSEDDQLVLHQRASAVVAVRRTSVVLLSSSFDPHWRVQVDGHRAPVEMIAPALLGVRVSSGRHVVTFTYVGAPGYAQLYGLAVVAFVGSAVANWYWRRRPLAKRDPF